MSPAAGPVVYPFVQAAYAYGLRKAPALALLVHMAEGGGTVGYLSHDPARGVSVHFVLERDGRIVQMLPLNQASGSVNPRLIRTSDDPPFTGYNADRIVYGASAARAVLGEWWRNPNEAVITIEIEGFAAQGPNLEQRKALVLWSREMRRRLPSLRGNLAHRDFAAYKSCPGRLVNWQGIGGHGLYVP